MLAFAKSSLLGLDIGSTMIKAVELGKKAGRVAVRRAGIAATPAGAVCDGVFLDPAAVSDCIRKLCQDQGLHSKSAAVALAGEDVFITRLKLERTAEEVLPERIRQEAARLARVPLENAALDFQVLETSSDSQWMDALVVAVTPEKIRRMDDLLRRAGKVPKVVDSAACALANAYQFNYQPEPSHIAALVHVGAALMTVCIVHGQTPFLARDLSLAPRQFSEEEWSMADRIAVQLERVFELMDEIADEHPLEPRSSQIERLLVSGGGCRLRGLEHVLRERVGLAVEEMNPLLNIDFENSDSASRPVWDHLHCMPVAIGLALRGFEDL